MSGRSKPSCSAQSKSRPMPNQLELQGVNELKLALRQLPPAFATEARAIVLAHAEEAKRQIEANYAHSVETGNLIRSLSLSTENPAYGARAILRNRARHAYWYEHGTEFRYTSQGVARGRMPAGHAFIPPAQRERRLMVHALMQLIRRAGFVVHEAEAA